MIKITKNDFLPKVFVKKTKELVNQIEITIKEFDSISQLISKETANKLENELVEHFKNRNRIIIGKYLK